MFKMEICEFGRGKFRTMLVSSFIFSILLSSSLFIGPVTGIKCPGKCISNTTQCKLGGGKIAGYCTNQRACCDYSYRKMGSCGSKMSNLTTAFFRSPSYPDYTGGDLICQFDFHLNSKASGIIIEFTEITMDGTGLTKESTCESDIIYFKGFPDWTPPPQCGNLTNYAAVIDLGNRHTKGMSTFTLLAIMSSSKYKWNIKVSQIYLDEAKPLHFHPTLAPIDYSDSEEEEGLEYEELLTGTSSTPASTDGIIFMDSMEDKESEEEEIARITQVMNRFNRNKATVAEQQPQPESLVFGEDYGDDKGVEEEPFIVNGVNSDIAAIPWQASLRQQISKRAARNLADYGLENCTIDEGLHFCGGSVISSRHILSAAHCFAVGGKLSTWQRLSVVKVVLGDSNTCDEVKDNLQEFKVDKVYYHYAYDDRIILNDVVVIKLKGRIRFNDYVRPIKLAKEGISFEHRIGMASGWGLTNLTADDQSTAEQLQSSGDLLIGNRSHCSKEQMKLYPSFKRVQVLRYPKYEDVFASLLCTYIKNGSVARLVGQGDSGGGLVVYPEIQNSENSTHRVDKTQDPVLAGVISYMLPVAHSTKPHDVSKYVDFYQSVSFYRNWIELAMQ